MRILEAELEQKRPLYPGRAHPCEENRSFYSRYPDGLGPGGAGGEDRHPAGALVLNVYSSIFWMYLLFRGK